MRQALRKALQVAEVVRALLASTLHQDVKG